MSTRRVQDLSYYPVEPAQLDRLSVIAQCLDNQWVPDGQLKRMLSGGLGLTDVAAERERLVRAEYLRALINTPQVVINRAFIYNNPTVFRDYLDEGPNREAFKRLLQGGAIIPYLFKEKSPDDQPSFVTDRRGFPAWLRIAQEVPTRCLRLSWNDSQNAARVDEELAGRFHAFAESLSDGDLDVYGRDLGLKKDALNRFRQRLLELSNTCNNIRQKGGFAKRGQLYSRFVTVDGTPTTDGQYDSSKPFACEIKKLLDLSYNMNLPESLGVYALTPTDSLTRTALQEWRTGLKPIHGRIDPEELIRLLRNVTYSAAQSALNLSTYGDLELQDVSELRTTDEWATYMNALGRLIENPTDFPDPKVGAPAVYSAYIALMLQATRLVAARRKTKRQSKWSPVIRAIVEAAGATLSISWFGATGGAAYVFAGEVSKTLSKESAPLVVRLVTGGLSRLGANAELATSLDVMEGQLSHAKDDWEFIVRKISETKGFESAMHRSRARRDATLNRPGERNG